MSTEHLNWFCGINTTLVQEEDFINSTCTVNGTIVVSQLAFSIIFIITPIFLKCCTSYGKLPPSPYVFRLPGHTLRWILTFVYSALSLAMIGEGVLTNDSFIAYALPGQPHLYIPGIFTMIAAVASLLYYHMMEKWRARAMIWFLLVYWMWSLVIFAMKMVQLEHQGLNDWQIFTYDVTLAVIVLIGALFLNELTLFYSLACRGCGDPLNAPKHQDTQKAFMKYRHQYSTLLSSLTFWWMNWLFILGYKRAIEPSDLGNIPEVHTSEYNHRIFKRNFEKEKERAARKGREISLYRVYWNTYSFKMVAGGLFKLAADFSNYVGPLCISGIIVYATTNINTGTPQKEKAAIPHYTTTNEFFSNGFVLVGCIFIAAIMKGIFDQCYQYFCFIEGLHAKSAIQSMVYEKSLRLSTYAMSGGMMTQGQITNHMSLDATNIQQFFNWGNELWTTPIKFGVTLYLLYLELGVPSLIGGALLVSVLPVQLIFAGFTSKYIKQVLLYSDQRMKYSNEMLQGIKILKLYGWERVYCKLVQAERAKEMRELAKVYFIQAVNFVINIGIPTMVNLVSFSTYTIITGEPLSPDIAFSSLYLFNSLVDPMFIFPYVISLAVNSHISTKRVKFFLVAPEIEGKASEKQGSEKEPEVFFNSGSLKSSIRLSSAEEELDSTTRTPLIDGRGKKKMYSAMGDSSLPPKDGLPGDVAIRIKDGCFTWDPDSHEAILKDINVDIPAGKLTIVVGTVGSGKSSVLQAVLGEMTTLQGRIQISKGSKIAYAPQKAWLVNTSLRENILFGERYDPAKYRKVVEACALAPDIDMLPAGDATEIGEKGLNLSGGQKQRVSVARTMYSGRDIIILDDPLSALDMHVGSHLFENGITKILKKQKQTIILVTHQLQYLPEADKIIIMKNGQILREGDPDEIARADPSLMRDWQQAIKQMSESETEMSESEALLEERRSLKRQISFLSSSSTKDVSSTHDDRDDERGRLIVTEDQEKGSVSYGIYLYYLKAVGYWVALLVAFACIAGASIEIATNFWLAKWSEASLQTNNTQQAIDDASYYITNYAILSAFNVFFRMTYVAFICFGMYFAAKKLHYQMLLNVISIPLRFFDTTPTGRILNRLSSDTQLIDQRLVQSMRLFINISVVLLSAFVIIISVNIYFIFFVIPIAVVFVILLMFYVVTSRELQRCESVTRSPIFAHFSETLGGLPTLRAFKDEKRFFQTALDRILINNRVFTYLITAQRWVGIRLDLLGAVVVLFSSLLCLLGAFYFGIDVSLVGLAISYSLEVSLFMNLCVRAAAEVELQMNAVERVKYYAELPTEDYSGTEPPPSWPDKGLIEMDNISVRYAQELDAVLTDVDLTIPVQNKLGICGRTGSGKSSLTLALFRIIDTFKGRIIIDGIDIATVPLLSLRQRLSIIPQDAFLFTGTIRSNLDPTNDKRDEQLWQALEIAQLKDIVTQLDMGLDYQVTEGGDNFSVGQRQLFCLARAFLRNSKIVVMDEATASIDQETDLILQDVVADVFQDRTVLTIAHRVSTILNADSILTLQDGKVIEYDSPNNLLDDDTSMFASLVKAGK